MDTSIETTTREANLASTRLESSLETKPEFELPHGHQFSVTVPEGDIAQAGISDLTRYLACQSLRLPDDFEYVWCTKRGTLPKRIQSHFFKSQGTKLTPEQLSEIGNIARQHCSKEATTFHLDFNHRFDWSAGDFGDGGSCFWGCNHRAKEMMRDNGACAVRSFTDETRERGNGRAWVAKEGARLLIVFNGYGHSHLVFARLLSMYFQCTYKKIELTNNGNDGGTLYINSGGYAVGDWNVINGITSHDFGWEDPAENHRSCHHCDESLSDDEAYTAYDRYGDTQDYCSGCCFQCDDCRDWYGVDRRHPNNDDEDICRACGNARERAALEAESESAEMEVI